MNVYAQRRSFATYAHDKFFRNENYIFTRNNVHPYTHASHRAYSDTSDATGARLREQCRRLPYPSVERVVPGYGRVRTRV